MKVVTTTIPPPPPIIFSPPPYRRYRNGSETEATALAAALVAAGKKRSSPLSSSRNPTKRSSTESSDSSLHSNSSPPLYSSRSPLSPTPPPSQRHNHNHSHQQHCSRNQNRCRCFCCTANKQASVPSGGGGFTASIMTKQQAVPDGKLVNGRHSAEVIPCDRSTSKVELNLEGEDEMPNGVAMGVAKNGSMLAHSRMGEKLTKVNELQEHRCLRDLIHVVCGMKLLVAVGLLAIAVILTLEAIYFRRAIFILIIPTMVTCCTAIALAKKSHHLVWPIIGISFFHMFLASYLLLIFGFYFFFKPNYIIMILNWAFDTLHTKKTLSFYLYSLAITSSLTFFFFFNLWQLMVSMRFRDFLHSRRFDRGRGSGGDVGKANGGVLCSPSSDSRLTIPIHHYCEKSKDSGLCRDELFPAEPFAVANHRDVVDNRKGNIGRAGGEGLVV